MKVSFTILCFVLLWGIVAGCLGTKDTSNMIDPVVGSWVSGNFKMTFFENGKGVYGGFLGGDWKKNNETSYVFTGHGADAPSGAFIVTIGFMYDPRFDTLSTMEDRQIYHRACVGHSIELNIPGPVHLPYVCIPNSHIRV